MNVSIRTAKSEDLNDLLDVFSQTIMDTCKNEYTVDERKLWSNTAKNNKKWREYLNKEYFIVAEKKGVIIGFSSLKNKSFLNLMYVHKDYIRKGVASLLYKNIKSKSLEHGVKKLTADVSMTAKPFFEKLGFRVLRENKNILETEVLINYTMTE